MLFYASENQDSMSLYNLREMKSLEVVKPKFRAKLVWLQIHVLSRPYSAPHFNISQIQFPQLWNYQWDVRSTQVLLLIIWTALTEHLDSSAS